MLTVNRTLKLLSASVLILMIYIEAIGLAEASNLPKCTDKSYRHNCFGTYEYPKGESHGVYTGEFQNNLMNGQGQFVFGSTSPWAGDRYVGEWKDGYRHGYGTYFLKNGDRYVGQWKHALFDGEGKYIYANGSITEGVYKAGVFQYAKSVSEQPDAEKPKLQLDDSSVVSASSGSGFAVSKNGYVVTNHHVIDGCQDVFVHAKGLKIPAQIIAFDPQNDLALLKGNFQPAAFLPLSDDKPQILQDVYVAGYPFGMNVSSSVKVTKGIISSLTGIGNNYSQIQIDAALQSGNSGGPILDSKGNVVGVAVSKLDVKFALENFGSIPENTNFGIKSTVVDGILDSNGVASSPANKTDIAKAELGRRIVDGTYFISCWMTLAQIERMRSKKVMFSELD